VWVCVGLGLGLGPGLGRCLGAGACAGHMCTSVHIRMYVCAHMCTFVRRELSIGIGHVSVVTIRSILAQD